MIAPVKVSATEDGVRLHRWLARHYSGANIVQANHLCRSGEIRVNSKRVTSGAILRAGDIVRVPPSIVNRPAQIAQTDSSQKFSLEELERLRKTIIHNDSDLVIFNKSAGLAVQGGSGVKKSLDRMAAALFPNDTVLLVHRLDKETSGIIIVAKNQMAAQKLSAGFQGKEIHKEYIALLAGSISPKQGVIDSAIDGKKAITKYNVIGELKGYLTFVRFTPETGRKHQLRIHSSKVLNAPIVGDDLYGTRALSGNLKTILSPNHLYLFAARLTFRHPRTGKNITINAVMPSWMQSVAELCEVEVRN